MTRSYHGGRLISEHEAGFVVITPAGVDPPVPIACSVCGYLMRTKEDERAFNAFGCCDWCEHTWARPNRDRWNGGWRPSLNEVSLKATERPRMRVVLEDD